VQHIGAFFTDISPFTVSQFGPTWKAKTPLFEISVHDPQKRKSLVGLSDYTICAPRRSFDRRLACP
jgi:hypothetical protein